MQEYSFFYTDTKCPSEKFEKIIAANSKEEAWLKFNDFLNFLVNAGRIVHETSK
jgi:hypothetical protein